MQNLTMRFTVLCLMCLSWNVAVAAEPLSVEDAAEVLTKRRNPGRGDAKTRAALDQARKDVLDRAEREDDFRDALVAMLVERVTVKEEPAPVKSDEPCSGPRRKSGKDTVGELHALRDLKATEAVPNLLKLWDALPIESVSMDSSDPRTQLIYVLATLQTGETRRAFLTKVMDDPDEPRNRRLHALIALCATGDEAGIAQIVAEYKKDCDRYGRTLGKDAPQVWDGKDLPWDRDGDGLNDLSEQAVLLDPTKADTDGDGIIDSKDRNPLTAPAGEPTETQRAANYLVYLYVKYLRNPQSCWSPNIATRPPARAIQVQTTHSWTNKGDDMPTLFADLELVGIRNVILAVTPITARRFNLLHGPNSVPCIYVNCVSDDEHEDRRESCTRLHKIMHGDVEPGVKLWNLNESTTDGGVIKGELYGNTREWHIEMKKFGNVWLPVKWRLGRIT